MKQMKSTETKLESETQKEKEIEMKSKELEQEKIKEDIIIATPMVLKNKTKEGALENPTESYEPLQTTFQREISQSTHYLNDSVRLLHTQTTSLLKSPVGDESIRKVDTFNIDQARQNMNTLAKLIQTKVNLYKLLK